VKYKVRVDPAMEKTCSRINRGPYTVYRRVCRVKGAMSHNRNHLLLIQSVIHIYERAQPVARHRRLHIDVVVPERRASEADPSHPHPYIYSLLPGCLRTPEMMSSDTHLRLPIQGMNVVS